MASTDELVELAMPSLAMKTPYVPHGVRVRRLAPPEATFLAEFHAPEGAKAGHAVAVIGGSGGGLTLASEQAAAFAESGIDALGIAYFKEPGLPETLAEIPLEYFVGALDWFRGAVGADRLVVVGISRGSEAALLLGVHFPQLADAVAAVVPGNVALCSWPPGRPAWTLRGEPLPYVGYFGPASEDPEAVIPVERIRGPLLLLSAGADRTWPSEAMASAIVERRRSAGRGGEDVWLHYPDAGHAIGHLQLTPAVARAAAIAAPDQAARRDAWPKVLDFIRGGAPAP